MNLSNSALFGRVSAIEPVAPDSVRCENLFLEAGSRIWRRRNVLWAQSKGRWGGQKIGESKRRKPFALQRDKHFLGISSHVFLDRQVTSFLSCRLSHSIFHLLHPGLSDS